MTEVFRFESDCGHFKDDPLPDGKPVQLLPQTSGARRLADRGACSTTRARVFWARCRRLRLRSSNRTEQKAVTIVQSCSDDCSMCLNNIFVAGLIFLVPAHLSQSHSLHCAHAVASSAVAVLSVDAIFVN